MKYFLRIFFILLVTTVYSQDSLHLKNGTIIEGRVYKIHGGKVWFIPADKIKNIRYTSSGRFKKDSWKNSKKYSKRKIKKIVKEGNEIYKYRDINGLESILSREVVTGKMNLYAAYFDFKNGNNSGYMPGYMYSG